MNNLQLAKNIRLHALKMTGKSGASHIGAILSIADIVAVLYNDVLKFDASSPKWENRDRFILSKGHAGVAVYAALAEKGFFPIEDLDNYYSFCGNLSGHVSHKNVPGVEVSTGSLGHGVCIAAGIALALKLNDSASRVYVITGDGECNEGSLWETIMFASHHKLNNLIIIVDKNNMQATGFTKDIINLSDLGKKFKAFNCNVKNIDGHNHEEIKKALISINKIKPTVIIANTIKGKGVSFMENQLLWHYKNPSGDLLKQALAEINGFGALEPFIEKFPNQFFNCGIAEQNMMSVAAGLALEGKKVFCYSITNFPTLRCLEQIRNGIAYHNLDVKIICIGAGLEYGALGITHHATEDIAALRALPNITLYSPSTALECSACMDEMLSNATPCYLRLNKSGIISNHPIELEIAKIEKGQDIAIISTGTILKEAIAASKIESRIGVYSIAKLKPLNIEKILEILRQYKKIITLEEHQITGGLGSAIAEIIAQNNINCKLKIIGIPNIFTSKVGNQTELLKYYGIDSTGEHLINKLVDKNYFIYAVIRQNSNKKLDIQSADLSLVKCDLEDISCLNNLIKEECHAFFHFSWNGTRGALRNDEALQENNYNYSMQAVEVAKKLNCKYFIGAGSQAEYGINFDYIDENTIAKPNTAYGKYKLKFTANGSSLCEKYNINFIMPRFFSLYGPNDYDETVIQSNIKKMLKNETCQLTDCTQLWNFMHFSDAADAMIYLMENTFTGIYNFASPETFQLKEFINRLYSFTNSKSILKFGAIPQSVDKKVSLNPNIEKLLKTGFIHKIPFDEVPTFNEEENIRPLCEEIVREIKTNLQNYDYEIIFIDNKSEDKTREVLSSICSENKKIKAIFNAKNFGQFNSPYYGLQQATGDCVILLCADFQDPIEMISIFVREWEKGFKIVAGVKSKSKENKAIRFARSIYYNMIKRMSRVLQIRHFTGFGLYDKSFIKVLQNLDDSIPYLRGIVAELGFDIKIVKYQQQKRKFGRTSNNLASLYDAAMLGITTYTTRLPRFATIFGAIFSFITFLSTIALILLSILTGLDMMYPLFSGIAFLIFLNMFFIGILGEYIIYINKRLIKRPLVIEEKRLNFEEENKVLNFDIPASPLSGDKRKKIKEN
ncbi:transketolase [Holotrichia oblita]|nr:transketolase [Holotrichia oblita]